MGNRASMNRVGGKGSKQNILRPERSVLRLASNGHLVTHILLNGWVDGHKSVGEGERRVGDREPDLRPFTSCPEVSHIRGQALAMTPLLPWSGYWIHYPLYMHL